MKCLLKDSPFQYIMSAFIGGILVFGIMLMIAESPLDRIFSDHPYHNFYNSCWEAICTMTTVGFGDIYPRTPLGRCIMFACAIWGVAIVSVLLVTFNEQLAHTSAESNAFTVMKKLELRERLKTAACNLLTSINKKHSKNMISEFERYKKIKAHIAEFRALRRTYRDTDRPEINEKLNFSNIDGQLQDLKSMMIGKFIFLFVILK